MNRILLISITLFFSFYCLNGNAQDVTKGDALVIDSLNTIINNPETHDTLSVKTYVSLSEILFTYSTDTVIYLSEKADSIISKNLLQKTSPSVKRSLLLSRIDVYNSIGFIHCYQGDFNAGLKLFKESKKVSDEIGDTISLGLYYNNIGWVYENQGNIIYALECYHRALKILKKVGNDADISDTLFNIGVLYNKQKEHSTALDYYKKCLVIDQALDNSLEVASTISAMGKVYHTQKKYSAAIESYTKSLMILQEIDDNQALGYAFCNIATSYSEMGNNEKALEYYLKSIEMQEKYNIYGELATSYTGISAVYYELNQINKSSNYANKGFGVAQDIGEPSKIAAAAEMVSIIKAKQNNYKAALEMYQLYVEMKDSVQNAEILATIVKHQSQYEFEKKEISLKTAYEKKETAIKTNLLISNEKLKSKSILLIGASLIALITFIYSIVLFRKKRKEQQLNTILVASNEVITKQAEELQKDLDDKVLEDDSFYFIQSAIQIKFEDIVLLKSSNHYVLIHVKDRKNPLLERTKMTKLMAGFPNIFVKVHRSHYVNVNHIISRPSKYLIKMSNGADVKMSATYVKNLGDKFLT